MRERTARACHVRRTLWMAPSPASECAVDKAARGAGACRLIAVDALSDCNNPTRARGSRPRAEAAWRPWQRRDVTDAATLAAPRRDGCGGYGSRGSSVETIGCGAFTEWASNAATQLTTVLKRFRMSSH